MEPLALPRLMLVTDRHRSRRDLVALAEQAARGGVGVVQIREKDLDDDAIRDLVTRIRARVPISTGITVNGRPHKQFDPEKEWVLLPGNNEAPLEIAADYERASN